MGGTHEAVCSPDGSTAVREWRAYDLVDVEQVQSQTHADCVDDGINSSHLCVGECGSEVLVTVCTCVRALVCMYEWERVRVHVCMCV